MPPYWKTFIEHHQLTGRELLIPAESDVSGTGAEIEILDAHAVQSEQTELCPGIAVAAAGFVPVGGCACGSGDPYFIRFQDGEGGPLYRIYHDEVSEAGYDEARAVAIVLHDYRDLSKYARV
ncbi:MAG TPA: hypothetical protein VF593_07205 [Chthoniobacteraceae bacterium]|jgi:hypothetical protein